ncbi:bifunctional cytochrome P450/NADPH--P450 reductase 2 [Lentzea sp. NBRC 105346]|uniref:bifunctional cytochrome P450/NADPH--P450 reductase n=1 Tax=Lentzea sp. NBRC 105346 TaxID=3032205 RepID=UPI0024A30FA6|nr:cytochrome P450 [Lentzea sp. NBRC 105346]GLZ29697.1 bifunctional cytochrome P450/NADPH--P450 reductase 2 [Lentzea sp. NBRC 105346]
MNLPHPKGRLPIVGDLASLTPGHAIQDAMRQARELGPVFTRKIFNQEIVFVGRLDLVEELSDETRFAKHVGPGLQRLRPMIGDGLFSAYNDEPNWAKAHDLLIPAFAMSNMRMYHPTMLEVSRRLIRHWDKANGPVDVPGDMTRMTLDTIGLAGFKFDFESFERDEPHPFVEAMVRCLAWAQEQGRHIPGMDFLYRKGSERYKNDIAFVNGIVDDVIASRRGDTSQDDLLGLMLNNGVLDEENIRNQIVTFLIAGHETTSGALSFALYYLAKNPAALANAQAEVDALWGDADPDPSYEDIGKLRYVRQVLNEALRLWPTAPAFMREAKQDTTLGGVPVHKGQPVVVLTPVLHRDPVWGDNVEAFDPERFSPERESARPADAFKPFGTGERACIGRQFALHEATMLLGMLIHRFRFVDHADYQLEIKETLTIKPEGFTLEIRPRTERRKAQTVAAQREEVTGRIDAAVTVLHGSNLGNAKYVAGQVASALSGFGAEVRQGSLDSAIEALGERVVLVAASYNGKPTDDAVEFVRWLETTPDLSGVSYAVLGVGDRNWADTYQRVPTHIDELLEAAGATRIVDRGEVDASGDQGTAVEDFVRTLASELITSPGAAPVSNDEVRFLTGDVTDALYAGHEMSAMTVLESRELAAGKWFLKVRLPEGVTYRTADHLTVLPSNPADLVTRACTLLHLDPDAVVSVRGKLPIDRPLTVRTLLTHFVELQDELTPAQVEVLAANNPCPPEKTALQTATGRILDLIERFPALRETLPFEVFLSLLPALRPRHYSISSSALAQPGEADLMISVTPHGIASNHLASLRPGDVLRGRVAPCRNAFRQQADVPVIMVGAGTGLAPFRGAIIDRPLLGRTEPALCYFGCQTPDDYLHRAELEAGDVSMRPVFSRAPERGLKYVQHRVLAEEQEVWELLEQGAYVYVCGDAKGMAPGVREAFQTVYRKHTGATDEEAAAWLADLVNTDRYVEDVY